jgi:lipoprotein-anchoring transpeptidase ErfK/SrfK
MTVSRKKHLWTVYTLYSVIAVLVVILVLLTAYNLGFLSWGDKAEEKPFVESDEVYLQSEESVIISPNLPESEEPIILPIEKVLFEYVEVKDSCGVHYEGECVIVRASPSTEAKVVTRLRNHVILKVGGKVEHEGRTWYKIIFDEHLRYPERVVGDWYIASEYVDVLFDEGDKTVRTHDSSTTTKKRIIVDRSKQTLYAYDDEELFMETKISTGLELTPTPAGTFTVFKKTPSRYMQGPLPGFSDYYDLPGVPWNLYFTEGGAVIHGAYWHDSFGLRYSHGCVNLSPEDAKLLYKWAVLGTKVTVK